MLNVVVGGPRPERPWPSPRCGQDQLHRGRATARSLMETAAAISPPCPRARGQVANIVFPDADLSTAPPAPVSGRRAGRPGLRPAHPPLRARRRLRRVVERLVVALGSLAVGTRSTRPLCRPVVTEAAMERILHRGPARSDGAGCWPGAPADGDLAAGVRGPHRARGGRPPERPGPQRSVRPVQAVLRFSSERSPGAGQRLPFRPRAYLHTRDLVASSASPGAPVGTVAVNGWAGSRLPPIRGTSRAASVGRGRPASRRCPPKTVFVAPSRLALEPLASFPPDQTWSRNGNPPFLGVIVTTEGLHPSWPAHPTPPRCSNVLLVVLDDVASPSWCYGSTSPPDHRQPGRRGVRLSNFHTTPCARRPGPAC